MPLKTPWFWYQRNFASWFTSKLLCPVSCIYQKLSHRHRRSKTPKSVNVPVICVGNLTAGGAGKTPTVMALTQLITDQKLAQSPYVIMRGYGSKTDKPVLVNSDTHSMKDVGDEALLIARHVPVIVCADRYKAAQAAIKLGADVIVMDDGLYNYDLVHDLDIVVVDGMMGFGNQSTIPSGPLREPLKHGLKRADLFIFIGDDKAHVLPLLQQQNAPIIPARIQVDPSVEIPDSHVTAFCGLGYPEKFYSFLRDTLNMHVYDTISFADHHPYSKSDMSALRSTGRILVTTEKDYVRIPEYMRNHIVCILITLQFSADHIKTLISSIQTITRKSNTS